MRVLTLLLLWISTVAAAASTPPLETLGIPPQDEAYYRGGVMKCRDGSGKFTRDRLNDDFCDCPDGTDEPGTSACPEGKFYCQNAGHSPITIFSSRVNDGICEQKRLIETAEEEERLIKEKEEKRIKEEAEKKAAEEKKSSEEAERLEGQE